MTLYDLRGNEMYFGSRKIGKAYFNNETIFDKTVLVFPNPPQYHLSPTYAYFFGAGEEKRYAGSQASLLTPGLTLQENGLIRSAGSRDNIIIPEPSSYSHQNNGIYEFTIENNFDHLEPGETSTLFYPAGSTQFYNGTWYLSQKKDVDGNTFISIGSGSYLVDVPIMDDRAYIHIAVMYSVEPRVRTARIYINGERKHTVFRETSAQSTGIGSVTIYPFVPIYDLKFYGDKTMESIITNNYNYISKLKFIKTKELVFDEPALVFPEPPTISGAWLPKWAYFFGSGEIINYYGSGVIEELNAGVVKENGLYLEEPINFHDFTDNNRSMVFDMTLERPNDIIDSLEPGKSVKLIESRLANGNTIVAFIGKGSDGSVRIGVKPSSTSVFKVDIDAATPIGDAEYIHIAYSNNGSTSGPYYSFRSQVIINGVTAISSGGSTRSGAQRFDYAKIFGGILLYDLKIYTRNFNEKEFDTLATANYNSIKDLTFVRTDQL